MSGKNRKAMKDFNEAGKNGKTSPFACFYKTENIAVHGTAVHRSKPSGHLLPVLAFPQVTLAHVVIKAHVKIMKKQQVVLLVFFHPVQQGAFLLPGPFTSYFLVFSMPSAKNAIVLFLKSTQFFRIESTIGLHS